MSNSYFQFKQFTVYQDRCSMKVSTDACILGAFAANYLHGSSSVNHILDIGAGTGLLSLMLAQKTVCPIDAVELEEAAATQAKENFDTSPWNDRLKVIRGDAFLLPQYKQYDCIISNPPFYGNDLRSPDEKKNAAKHDTTLTIEQLVTIADRHLSQTGIFFVLLPYHRLEYFVECASAQGLYLLEQLNIQHSLKHPYTRGILVLSREQRETVTRTMAIKDAAGSYSPTATSLLSTYYLNL